MFIGLVVFFVLLLQVQGCSKTPTPTNNENNTTVSDVAKNIALSPLYVIFGAVEVVKTVAIGAITVPVMVVKAITSNDVNNTK